jgi:alpha-tubulin suppressor-like RCC1 family protein
VGSLTTWLNVSAGFAYTLATKTDGTLWSWGYNVSGQLATGNTTKYSSPKQVGALTNWLTVSAGNYNSYAVKTDGTIWSWGLGTSGQLGLGNTTNYSSPKQIGALTTWSKIGTNFYTNNAYAIKTDGTFWSWGPNLAGQLGLGNITNYSSPKQMGSLTSWTTFAPLPYGVIAIALT